MNPDNREDYVLVATDLSPCSAAALRRAIRIAAWYRAPVRALHVVPALTPPTRGPLGPLGPDLPTEADLIDSAHRRWKESSKSVEGASEVTFEVAVGNPRDHILEVVRRDTPKLLVVGAHGRCDGSMGVGPVAAACVQRAATQVLVVRQQQAGPFRSVVACIDFSDASLVALQTAVSIAAEEEGALHILHAFTDPWQGLPPPDDIARNMPGFATQYTKAIETRLREFCFPLPGDLDAIRPAFHAVEAASHGQGINAFITERGCDLAVLGTRGTFNLRDCFWGSTAERVVREAGCSVLTVKPPGFIEAETCGRAGGAAASHQPA